MCHSPFATLRRAALPLVGVLPTLLLALLLTSAPRPIAAAPITDTGQLLSGGVPIASGLYDLKFGLYTAATGGTQVGSTLSVSSVPVEDGVFVVTLDFGSVVNGQTLYLQTAYRPHPSPGGTSYTTQTPRPLIPTSPYADYALVSGSTNALQGTGVSTTAPTTGQVLTYTGSLWTPQDIPAPTAYTAGTGLTLSGHQFSVAVPLALSSGGSSAVISATNTASNGTGVSGVANGGTAAYGVFGGSTSGAGIVGSSISGKGVYGTSGSGYAGYFKGGGTTGLYGESTITNGTGVSGVANTGSGAYGVFGGSTSGAGVTGSSTSGKGVYGTSGSGYAGYFKGGGTTGLYGESTITNGTGVSGVANTGSGAYGVFGGSTSGAGVTGSSSIGNGIYGSSMAGYGVYGTSSNNYSGYFAGSVGVTNTLVVGGDLNVSGNKNFQIDHPLHPDTMTLKHVCIESNLPENVYNGEVTTDAVGSAVVQLPDYFEALNKKPLYQLTVVGQFAQAVVATRVKDNQFTIKTDKPGVTVCWQVTGERNDAYQKAHPYQAEEQKAEKDQGKYLDPTSYGLPEDMVIGYQQQAHRTNTPKP